MKTSIWVLVSLFVLSASAKLNAQIEFAKRKVVIGNEKKDESIGILYTLHDDTYVFQYGKKGGEGFIDGKGISIYLRNEPDKAKLQKAIAGIDSWTYTDEFYEGEMQKGVKFGKGKLKDRNRYYEGDFENDKPHGFGMVKKFDGRKVVYQYSGYFFKGFPHGPGTIMEQGVSGVSVAHYPTEYFTAMILNGKPRGLTLYQQEGGKDKLQLDKTKVFLYKGSHRDIRSITDYINNDTNAFLNIFNYKNALNLSVDTIYNGKLNENKKLTGFGYFITSDGTIHCGNFSNGKLNGYGFMYSVTFSEEKMKETYYTNKTHLRMDGLFVNDTLVKGSKVTEKERIRNTPTAFEDYGGNLGELLDLELKKETFIPIYFSGTFNKEGILDGPSCYYSDEKVDMSGTFKNGKLHGDGKLVNREGTYTGLFEDGVFKKGTISYSLTGSHGPANYAVLMVDGLPGIYNQRTGKTFDGRTINDWSYYKGNSSDFFNYCKMCNGAGNVWKKGYSTYQQYTHLETKSSTVTYGSRTFVKTWSEPKYKTVGVTSDYSAICELCNGKGREPKSLEEIKRMFEKK